MSATAGPFPQVALRRLFDVVNGATPDSQNPAFWGGEVTWVTPEDLSDRGSAYIDESKRTLTTVGYAACGTSLVPAGSIVLSTRAPIGNLGIAAKSLCTNQGCKALVAKRDVSSRYFFYQLGAMGRELNRLGRGTTFLELSSSELAGFKVSAPSLAVQRCIASFLDDKTARIDALIAEKEQLIERLQAYQYSYSSQLMVRGMDKRASLARTSFPELGSVPAHWSVKRLKFLGEVRSGVAKGKDLGERLTVTLPYLRVANVQNGYVDLSEVSEIAVADTEAQRYLLRKGDVLMNEGGDNDKLGRGAVWQGQIDPCIHQNHVFAVRLQDPSLADWVSGFTSTDAARAYFFLRSKQSTNLASINQSNVRELPVPMPPAAERAQIMEELQRATKAASDLVQHAAQHIGRLREYRSSLISAAVTGQLDLGAYEATPDLASELVAS